MTGGKSEKPVTNRIGENEMEKQEKPTTNTANRYCHNCLHNWGSVCERDGHKVAQYEWCRHREERNEHVC